MTINTSNKHLMRLAAFVSGAFLTFAFAPFNFWPIAFASVAGFYLIVRHESHWLELWFRGFLFGIGKYAAGGGWILPSLINYANVNLVTAVMLFVIVAVSLSIWFAFVAFFAMNIKSKIAAALVFASGFCLLEICLTFHYGYSFPFLHVGYAFIDTSLAGYAPIGGVWVVSFIAVVTSIALVHLVEKYWVTLYFVAGAWVLGFMLGFLTWTQPIENHVLALVQANIPVEEKFDSGAFKRIWTRYESHTRQSDDAEIVIWPEGSMPTSFERVKDRVSQLVTSTQTPLLFGTFEHVGLPPNEQRFNVAIGFDGRTKVYRKQQLVPFGEYLPDLPIFTNLFKAVVFPMSSIALPDKMQSPIELRDLTMAISICYEIGYPQLINPQVQEGAELIVSISEDSWFGNTHGAWQQLQMARMRAVETGRQVVRVSNDGPTAIIKASGDVANELDRYVAGVVVDEVTSYEDVTPFTRWGLYPICALMLLSMLVAILSETTRKSQRDITDKDLP